MKYLIIIASLLCTQIVLAQSQAVQEALKKASIENVQRLPIKGVVAVESRGSVYFISDNGRFIFKGKVFDAFTGEAIATIEDAKRVATHIEFAAMRVKPTDLTPVIIDPDKPFEITVFVDPFCQKCISLVEKLTSDEMAEITKNIVLLPVLKTESLDVSARLYCLEADEIVERLISQQYSDLRPNQCGHSYIEKAAVTGQLLNINAVPLVVNKNGEFRYGTPDDLVKWATNQNKES